MSIKSPAYASFPLTTMGFTQLALLLVLIRSSSSCKPSFLEQQERDENPEIASPWRSFNFSRVTVNVEDSCECGRKPWKSGRISGGQDAEKHEFPWQAALVYRNTRIPFCGGTLINNLYVLTAAHCVLNLPKLLMTLGKKQKDEDFYIDNDFQVLLNAFKLTPLDEGNVVELYKRTFFKRWELSDKDRAKDMAEGTLRFDVGGKVYHPEFVTEYRKFGFDFDIALIKLARPVDLIASGQPVPICLPKSSKFTTYENKTGITIGWGRQDFTDMASGAPILQKLHMPVYSLDKCSSTSGVVVSKRFICAGHHTKSKDIGKSDSGGPLLLEEKHGKFIQIGIVSWGAGEKDGKVASAFTRVSAFLRWINYHIYKNATSSTSSTGSLEASSDNEVVWCSRQTSPAFRIEDMRRRPSSSVLPDEFLQYGTNDSIEDPAGSLTNDFLAEQGQTSLTQVSMETSEELQLTTGTSHEEIDETTTTATTEAA